MRRLIAICLLMLLPLQFSWAAVAAYCGHETDPQAQHLGHHVHPDAAADAAAPDTASGASDNDDHGGHPSGQAESGAMDLDGCHSHGCCLGIVCGDAVVHLGVAATAHPALLVAAVATLAHAPPDRPQWQRLA